MRIRAALNIIRRFFANRCSTCNHKAGTTKDCLECQEFLADLQTFSF